MTATTAATLKVGMRDLRNALTAVLPHAEPSKNGDEISKQHRIRCTAADGELWVMSTCTSTTAFAAVEIVEDSRDERFANDDGVFSFDIIPPVLRNVLQAFKAQRKGSADPDTGWAELAVTTDDVTLTDVSALFPGLSLRIPTLDLSSEFPDVHGAVKAALAASSGSPVAKPLVAAGKALALFRPASSAYGQPLTFEGIGTGDSRGFVVLCGPSFVGLVSSRHNDDDSLKRRDTDRMAHLRRFGLDRKVKAA